MMDKEAAGTTDNNLRPPELLDFTTAQLISDASEDGMMLWAELLSNILLTASRHHCHTDQSYSLIETAQVSRSKTYTYKQPLWK